MFPGFPVLKKALVLWMSLGFSLSFLLWSIWANSNEFQSIDAGLRLYGATLLPGLIGAGVILGLMFSFKMKWASIGWTCYISSLLYLGFLKTLDWHWVPWFLVVGTAVWIGVVLSRNIYFETRPSLFLFHVMGTMSGLYMAFHLDDFLKGWDPFKEVVGGLWLMLSEGLFKIF